MKKLMLIFMLCLFYAFAQAGSIDGELYDHMLTMADDEKAECMIVMSEQFDLDAFKRTMTMANSTRQERHCYVITSLQEIATRTQPPLLAELEQARNNDEVYEFRGYWISNIVYAQLGENIITEIADREDVDVVYYWQEPELIKPVEYESDPPIISGVERGLEVIHAPEMWELGYTGAGRLVANIDTGVDGNHVALSSRWRGNNGAPAEECWLDTTNPNSSYPYDTDSHGTHTMGTLTGLGESTGDTIGVAFDALWIASRAIVSNGNVYAAFQWVADPDGDPNTIEDVPDVVSNSWGYHDFTCPSYVWAQIDNCEAAGIVVVFAAGNRSQNDPYVESVWAPASRQSTPYNTFSVGAVDGNNNNFPIAGFSARGPSQCDHFSIKPEVVAPGVNVRSSVPGGGYQQYGWSGTSMACPHVAGAVALLRQYNPNATSDTIKWALMESAQDLGQNGEDNNYGHGIINVYEAMNLMPANENPNLYISGFIVTEPDDNYPDPGDDISLAVTLTNSGVDVADVYAIISTEDPYASITSDSSYYGDINEGESADNSDQQYEISFDEDTPLGRQIAFELAIYGSDYSTTGNIVILVGRLDDPEIADHDIGAVDYTVSNFGIYGLNPPEFYPEWQGEGFKTPRFSQNYLFEGALLIGDGPTRVSNGARDQDENINSGFVPITGLELSQPGDFGDQEYNCFFNDQNANEPLNITVEQASFAWDDAPDDNYIITEYQITNNGGEALTGLRVAHYEDWDMPWGGPDVYDRANFDRERNLGYQYSTNIYRGMIILNIEGAVSFRALHNDGEVYGPAFTLADKWSYMTSGFSDTAITIPENASIMLTTGPFDINPGQTVTAAFAILGSNSLSGLQETADAAILKYEGMTDIDELVEEVLPLDFGITGNYPNPFNPSAVISFSVDKDAFVKLEVYDLLGRKVKTLVDEYKAPGIYEVMWNGRDINDNDVASGVYFARLVSEDRSSTKKMLLLR